MNVLYETRQYLSHSTVHLLEETLHRLTSSVWELDPFLALLLTVFFPDGRLGSDFKKS